MTTIDWQLGSDGIALLTIDLKDRSTNVVTPGLLRDIAAAAERIASDGAVRGAVLTSGKPVFMAGADLHGLLEALARQRDLHELYGWCRRLQRALRALETCGKPVAAAINGTALGGGLELGLACHYRVAADEPQIRLGLPEVRVGLMPGGGGTQRLPRLIGIEAALRLIGEGRQLSPREACEAGFIDALAAPGDVVTAARRRILERGAARQPWDRDGFVIPGGAGLMHPRAVQTFTVATALMQQATHHNYPAPQAILSAVYEGTVLPIDKALEVETRYFVSVLRHPVARNMIRTLFVNKRAADRLLRRPAGPPRRRVTRLGVLGAGTMGAGIAYVSAQAGLDVQLIDTDMAKAERGRERAHALAAAQVERGRRSADEARALVGRIHAATDVASLEGCELVIEAVFEDRGIKAEVLGRAESAAGDDAILASNTSTLPITGLAQACRRPQRFVGIHFFSPVDRMPLVEVINGSETGDIAVAQALDYVRQIGKTPIVVNDSRGFYTSRVFGSYTREGMSMLAEGVAPALIENVARHAGMPLGPLAVTDEVSLELAYRIARQTMRDLGDDYVPTPADEVIRKLVEELDRKGRRYGKGFYDYPEHGPEHGPEDGGKSLWPGLARHFPPAARQPPPEELRARLLYVQALESVRCLEENVLTNAADADVGSVFGWGFPAWTGGTLSFIDSEGPARFVARAERLREACGERFAVPASLKKMAEQGGNFHPQHSGTVASDTA